MIHYPVCLGVKSIITQKSLTSENTSSALSFARYAPRSTLMLPQRHCGLGGKGVAINQSPSASLDASVVMSKAFASLSATSSSPFCNTISDKGIRLSEIRQ